MWALWSVELGENIGKREIGTQPSATFLTVPTRAFMSLLIAAGYVRALAAPSLDEHVARLKRFTPGPVYYRQANSRRSRQKLLLESWIQQDDVEYLKLTTGRSDGPVSLVPASRAGFVEPIEDADRASNGLGRRQRINASSEFSQMFMGAAHSSDFSGSTREKCSLVGEKHLLSNELRLEEFAVEGRTGVRSGRLQDIVKAKELIGQGESARAQISASRTRPRVDSDQGLVVFDGSRAFLRWRGAFPRRHWVVVLDRTDPQFSETVTVQADLYESRAVVQDHLNPRNPPLGIEVVRFLRG